MSFLDIYSQIFIIAIFIFRIYTDNTKWLETCFIYTRNFINLMSKLLTLWSISWMAYLYVLKIWNEFCIAIFFCVSSVNDHLSLACNTKENLTSLQKQLRAACIFIIYHYEISAAINNLFLFQLQTLSSQNASSNGCVVITMHIKGYDYCRP